MSSLLSEYLTLDELAKELRVTVRTIHRWQSRADGIPCTTLGGRTLFRIASVRAWIEAHERKPNPRRPRAA
ncbi:helix-turn-helix domain-containing protein [Aureimonas leprariae]|uniref:helix-turn-helix domain-containing protein n=1 Tax=Plantimonas leprariae TaxID=2615207 RepID=UPI001386CA35